MHDQPGEGPEAQEGLGGATSQDQPERVMEGTVHIELQGGQEEPERGMLQCWEAQWQQFLQSQRSSNSAWGSPAVPDPTPWEDAKAFLDSFEQVAAACGWPRGEWVARLTPALSGGALQAFSLLQATDREDYGKVKAAILRDKALVREVRRQHFRQFSWQELEDPRKTYIQIQALCCQWLKPERHTKEQILELLVLEQFLASLPEEAQSWVRAGGPDSCTQAVALLEDFLMSRRMAETGTWQEPLEECAVGCLDPKQEHVDMEQVEISKEHAEMIKDTEQHVDDEFAVPGIGIACPASLLPPGREDLSEAELTKALGIYEGQVKDLKKMGLPLHMTEQIPVQSSQRTTFWKVLKEEEENEESGDESSVRAHQSIEKIPLSVCSDDGKGDQLKVKNALVGGSDPVQTASSGKGETQEKVLVRAELKEEKSQSKSRQGIETECQESGELGEGLGAACSNSILVDIEGGAALFSKYGRRYHRRLGRHHSSQMEVKYDDVPEQEVSLNSSVKYHRIHTGERKYRCTNCGKRFSHRSNLLRHQRIHKDQKPHKCPECGKNFSRRSHLLRHEMIHTGEKPHKCPECGKTFSRRAHLLRHEMSHTGEKPHKCLQCGKNFSRKSILSTHQRLHTNFKISEVCEKKFLRDQIC